MNNNHVSSYYETNTNRSPISNQRHHTIHRTSSRHFDTYGQPSSSGLYTAEDHAARYDTNRYDTARLNGISATYGYDNNASQTWNPSSFNTGTLNGTNRMKTITRQRSALPTTWIEPPPPLPTNNPLIGLGGVPLGTAPLRSETVGSDPDEELIPTAIVIKNIPFAVKKEQLVQLMTDLNLPLPYAFNYHFDNGVFRGLAFANFTTPEETGAVIEVMNHFELQGRKLRVEYKKMLPLQERERIEREKRERRGQLEEQHRPSVTTPTGLHSQPSMSSLLPSLSPRPSIATPVKQADIDLNNPQTLQFYSQLLLFRDDASREALIFPSTLSPAQRRTVHTLAHHMSLAHVSRGSGDHRQVQVFRQAVPIQNQNISPPIIPTVMPVESHTRRTLARATTMDFSETRSADGGPGIYSTIGRQNPSLLDIPNSPSARDTMQNRQNLRAAKSFADLRSYTPSPVPTSASFPVALRENVQRYTDYGNGSVASTTTPSLTPTATSNGLNESLLVNGLAGVSLGGNLGVGGGSLRGDPRDRSILGMDRDGMHGPIGGLSPSHSTSSRSFSLNSYDGGDSRQVLPSRQPRGPDSERSAGFGRKSSRQQLHSNQSRSDMDMQSGVGIVVE